MELSAFGSCMFRTHIGLSTSPTNAQVYTDQDTKSAFAKFTDIYAFLADYRYELMQEAEIRGTPVMRPMAMHYAYDSVTYGLSLQYMFGDQFMVAPALDPGFGNNHITDVKVYLPAHSVWTHLWTGIEEHGGPTGKYIMVAAPLGYPPIFYVKGSVVGEKLRSYVIHKNLIQTNIKSKTFPVHTPGDWYSWLGVTQYVSKWEDLLETVIEESGISVDASHLNEPNVGSIGALGVAVNIIS